MIRNMMTLRLIQRFSKQIQPQKNNKLPLKNKSLPSDLLKKQMVDRMYLQFEALPTDPLNVIQQRYIKKKQMISRKGFYMPKKAQYLKQLDTYMSEIEAIHKENIARQSYQIPSTIGEKIQLQMQNQRLRFFFNIFREDKYIIATSVSIIVFCAIFEVLYCSIQL